MGAEPRRVTSRLASHFAPRSRSRTGARASSGRVGGVPPRVRRLALVAAVTAMAGSPASAQAPPDSAQAPDSADALELAEELADSISADTIFYNLPALDRDVPSGFATGVWEWDRDGIMASGANTLGELVQEVPGVVPLYGGDYGTPMALSAFGGGGGGYRVFRDGFELYPVEGGVVDLQHVGLVGVQRIRLDRSLGSLRIDLWSHRHDDGRPFSVVEAGTGDLDTNLFRGVFADPTALGGSVAFGLERIDTRGIGTDEGGNRTGTWVRYQLHLEDRGGIAFEYRGAGSQTKVGAYAPDLTRRDLLVRARYEVVDGVTVEGYTGRSTFDAEAAGAVFETWGGSRTQHGGRVEVVRGGAWVRGDARLFEGELPARSVDVQGGFTRDGWGGASGAVTLGRWGGVGTASARGRAWVGPWAGVTLFGAWESGEVPSRDAPLLDGLETLPPPFLPRPVEPAPGPLVAERTALRGGGVVEWRGVRAAGAFLLVDADRHLPLATELDLGAVPVDGVRRTGVEGWASVPLPVEGFRLEGSYQRWDRSAPYLPPQIYRGSLEYYRVPLESGNLEVWGSFGVRGHDPMSAFVAPAAPGDPTLVDLPFYQSWYARIQVRVVTVRLFLGWENFTLRRDLQTFPDRRLPFLRSFFGLRWDMWN